MDLRGYHCKPHRRPRGPVSRSFKRGEIELLCEHCGNRAMAPRAEYDPDRATLVVTNKCDQCHAAMGGFGTSEYYDICGERLEPQ
jgi:hypothetical protein